MSEDAGEARNVDGPRNRAWKIMTRGSTVHRLASSQISLIRELSMSCQPLRMALGKFAGYSTSYESRLCVCT